jgi:hypothetical protein
VRVFDDPDDVVPGCDLEHVGYLLAHERLGNLRVDGDEKLLPRE